ncbi:F-box and leucine-rich protein 22 isoform X3 [Suricata suricatta]|uniref:F-box and leucine-rich protein 22 isoform X3 n=1 Tax=Suricata suricatta TaxID=37032 RepID=UPI0011552F8D|nr:F-box and leucine-rich protein 22 isoform X3 [Suricata suricatta]
MHLTQLNRECLLHLFSFLDKDSRKNLARTCPQLQDVFEDPTLWPLLHFHSLIELKKDNFLLSPALRSLSICWYSSRVQVCSIEDWLKSAFQRSICSQHESLVNDFLFQVSQPGVPHAFRLRPCHRRLPRAPAALLPALALAAPGELRAHHQPHADCRGGARARAADSARGLLPQRERGRPAPPARRAPAPGAAGRTQRRDDPGPAP